jgi:hypothetical protein
MSNSKRFLIEGYVPYRPGMPSTIPQAEKDRRLRAALRLKERRSTHPYYGRRAAEA